MIGAGRVLDTNAAVTKSRGTIVHLKILVGVNNKDDDNKKEREISDEKSENEVDSDIKFESNN